MLTLFCVAWPAIAYTQSNEITLGDLFRVGIVSRATLSPTGEYVAYQRNKQIVVGNTALKYWTIHDFEDDEYIQDITWIGDNSLAVQTWHSVTREDQLYATRLELHDNGSVIHSRHEVGGYIDDPLLDEPEHVVFARYRWEDDAVAADLFRINVFDETRKEFRRRNAVITGSDEFTFYVQDQSGRYVAGLKQFRSSAELWRRVDEKNWLKIWTTPNGIEYEFDPISISVDGDSLYALSNAFTDRVALIEIDLNDGTLRRVIYEHERFDLNGLQMSDDGNRPLAVRYEDQGLYRYHFFDDAAMSEFTALQAKFPERGLLIIGRSEDRMVYLVHTSRSSDRGEVHRCDLREETCDLIGKNAPWLDGKQLADTIVLTVETEPGILVDSFLTLPTNTADSAPLIVLPHGGPITVNDSRSFTPSVQWLAANGYAVLQVNYRGSSGYGREFVAAGLQQWGQSIEDDIEASVLNTLEQYPIIDRDRVGIYGGSYGGYSALISVIRNPELFKCAASFAGVTDLTLIFSESRFIRNEEMRKTMVRIVGSPELDYETLIANSPVYRYREFKRPVFLAHGTDDNTVDVEHSWRLRLLMRMAENDPEFVILDDVGHSFETVKQASDMYTPLIAFLDKHLKP